MDIDEPLFDKKCLFEAREGGYATYRIPGIVVTARGTVLAYCEGRKHDQGDWGTIDIFLLLRKRGHRGGCVRHGVPGVGSFQSCMADRRDIYTDGKQDLF